MYGSIHTVLANQGIYLTLDRSGTDPLDGLVFGAWMDDAGFFVSYDSIVYRAFHRNWWRAPISDARMAAAVGERTGSRPAADARWRGSMVGSPLGGKTKGDILLGEAELKFDPGDSKLDARFFNIRNYDKFGEKHIVKRLGENQIIFTDIPVAGNGRYQRKYRKATDNLGGSISGAFYGESHHETAGTFRQHGILGAFGAKQVAGASEKTGVK